MKGTDESVKKEESIQKLIRLISNPVNIDKISVLSSAYVTPEEQKKLRLITRLTESHIRIFLAVNALCKNTGSGGFTSTPRTTKKISMGNFASCELLQKRFTNVRLSDNFPKSLRPVLAI